MGELALNFVISYLTNNIPSLESITNGKTISKRIKKHFEDALREWKCEMVHKKYEGKEILYLEDLKEYVGRRSNNIDAELKILLSRWVLRLQNDPDCLVFLNSIKIDSLLDSHNSNHLALSEDISQIIKNFPEQLSNICQTVQEQKEILNRFIENNSKIENLHHPLDIDKIMQRYMDESIGTKPVILEPVTRCVSALDTKICILAELIEEGAVFDHFVYMLCCRGGLSWYSNKHTPKIMYDTANKIIAFANVNRYFLSDSAYAMFRKHHESAISLCNALSMFVVTLEEGFDKYPDSMTDIVDITYDTNWEIGPKFVQMMMAQFVSVHDSPSYLTLSNAYINHCKSRQNIINQINETREFAL